MATVTKTRRNTQNSGARNAPFIGLDDAIARIRNLHNKVKRTSVQVRHAATHLGYSPKSSNVALVISALKKYGLIISEETAEGCRIRISDLAFKIVADSRAASPEREKWIIEAALLPKAHRELWEAFGPEPPDDDAIRAHLMFEKGYSEDAARNAAKVFRATIAFAKPDQSDILGDVDADEADSESATAEQPSATRSSMEQRDAQSGWEPQSAESPLRVLSIPLGDSRSMTFDLRFPRNLSEEDFAFVLENMKLWQRKIVGPAPRADCS